MTQLLGRRQVQDTLWKKLLYTSIVLINLLMATGSVFQSYSAMQPTATRALLCIHIIHNAKILASQSNAGLKWLQRSKYSLYLLWQHVQQVSNTFWLELRKQKLSHLGVDFRVVLQQHLCCPLQAPGRRHVQGGLSVHHFTPFPIRPRLSDQIDVTTTTKKTTLIDAVLVFKKWRVTYGFAKTHFCLVFCQNSRVIHSQTKALSTKILLRRLTN